MIKLVLPFFLLLVNRYRHFPVVTPNTQMVSTVRPYTCNFLGTVYKNSSRESLTGILKQNGLDKQCLTNAREKYVFVLLVHH